MLLAFFEICNRMQPFCWPSPKLDCLFVFECLFILNRIFVNLFWATLGVRVNFFRCWLKCTALCTMGKNYLLLNRYSHSLWLSKGRVSEQKTRKWTEPHSGTQPILSYHVFEWAVYDVSKQTRNSIWVWFLTKFCSIFRCFPKWSAEKIKEFMWRPWTNIELCL